MRSVMFGSTLCSDVECVLDGAAWRRSRWWVLVLRWFMRVPFPGGVALNNKTLPVSNVQGGHDGDGEGECVSPCVHPRR